MGKPNFIALNLSKDFTEYIAAICEQIKITLLEQTGFEFIPMEATSVHMTICFLGSVLETDRKNKTVIVNNEIENFSEQFAGKVLEFEEFSLFPDTKKNLIVAKFKCVDKKDNFCQNIIKFKKEFTKIGTNEENYFVPHITLGKIQNMSIKNINIVEPLLSELPRIEQNIQITGCHLV